MRTKPPWPRTSYPWSWWRDHGRVARESLRHVSQRLGGTLLAWLLVGIALALPAGLLLVQSGLSDLTGRWDNRPGLSVYFEPGVSPDVLATALRQQPGIERVEVVTQAQALAEFRAQALLGDAFEVLETNPLPASLRVVPIAGADFAGLQRLAEQARQHPGAMEVVVEKTLVGTGGGCRKSRSTGGRHSWRAVGAWRGIGYDHNGAPFPLKRGSGSSG